MTSLILRRGALVLLALLLAWQILTLQMANHFAAEAAAGASDAINTALWWDSGQAEALERKSWLILQSAGEQPSPGAKQQASHLLQQAVVADPSRATAVAQLAVLGGELGNEKAATLAALANRLAPVEPRVQRLLARYAYSTDDLAEVVMHTARSMVGAPETASQYYPMLMQVAADSTARVVLELIASDPRQFPWWNSFFAYVAANAQNLDALRALVTLREASTALPLQEYERNQYINRLRKEGLVKEAYLHWVNGLSQQQLRSLGYLYDGSFEQGFANDSGFGWVVNPPRNVGVRVSRGDTYGASGNQALRLSFRGKRVRFSHLYQHLFLGSGSYTVSGRVRPDKLKARRGLQWRVYCTAGASGTLGESELFVSSGDWRKFEFTVTVPPECSGQMLRLYSAGNREVDHELDGAIWFDDLDIGLNK